MMLNARLIVIIYKYYIMTLKENYRIKTPYLINIYERNHYLLCINYALAC